MDFQFYPTGAHTAARMWAKFKRPISHLVEPSAGSGALIRYAKEGFQSLTDDEIPWLKEIPDEDVGVGRFQTNLREHARKKFSGIREISVVEIDLQHHPVLKELGAKVLGYDFLQVQSLATASHVIMNPPFRDGCAHVLHAWDKVYDAEIVAIVNAETVKNAYSRDRQRLVELIEQHGSVEFLQDQFVDDVERKTDVEVALIHLEKVPVRYLDMDAMLSGLKRGDNGMSEVDPQVCSALALPSNFIHDTFVRFEQAVEAARMASETLALSDKLTSGLGITLEEMQAKGVGNDFRETLSSIRETANNDFKERYLNIKQRAWAQILRSSLLTDKLSNQARRKIEASAASIYDMEFSIANVHGFLAGVIESMGDIYRDMVCDLFDTIIERSSDNVVFYKSWKSNQKHRIGVRIRKSRFIIPNFHISYGNSLSYESVQFLSDIDKVFGYLHGITGAYDGLVQGFNTHRPESGERISTRFFDVRFYKGASTMHFFPKSEDVVEKINRFVGKLRHWIPSEMEEANSDFQKQYDKGETYTKDYLEAYRNSARNSYGLDRPAIQLLREIKAIGDEDRPELDRLERAIEAVHDSKGLHCGPALKASTPLKAIAFETVASSHRQCGEQQLLLMEA